MNLEKAVRFRKWVSAAQHGFLLRSLVLYSISIFLLHFSPEFVWLKSKEKRLCNLLSFVFLFHPPYNDPTLSATYATILFINL